jgi:selenoprotein W-related protein
VSKLLEAYKQKISELTLEPGSGGCFEISFDGELVYSKLKTGDFPDESVILDLAGERLGT